MNARQNWLLFYRAASNRGNWLQWNLVLDDLISTEYTDKYGRSYTPFMKPTNQQLFYPKSIQTPFDVCIGASHIHDKKAQYKTVFAALEYRKLYSEDLHCVMPGRSIKGDKTNAMYDCIREEHLSVATPGMVDKDSVNTILNSSKLFIHMGMAGQNDRGLLEALACGTPALISNIQYHAPFTYANSSICHIVSEKAKDDPIQLAREIREALEMVNFHGNSLREQVANYFIEKSDIDKVIVPWFSNMFNILQEHPHADRAWLAANLFRISRGEM
jgi:glycosyltransferase involved in cell wall biosynthesis